MNAPDDDERWRWEKGEREPEDCCHTWSQLRWHQLTAGSSYPDGEHCVVLVLLWLFKRHNLSGDEAPADGGHAGEVDAEGEVGDAEDKEEADGEKVGVTGGDGGGVD